MRTAKVFKQGNSQAVRLPKEFRVVETELLIKKSGDSIVLTPKKTTDWKNVRAAIAMFKGPIERYNNPKILTRGIGVHDRNPQSQAHSTLIWPRSTMCPPSA
jgi:antitoxin VapB